ncbi:hypothetical protein [Roseivirga sp. E12]|uniref:hypothetical protein n=1 Tax=Roseivirga sp. E12 TaxID=2819237 RepID=UPI001ABD44DB|nr:hypothetical protein [Roseivirga sp. E12]MBO3697989.1 hypothetical protein [Roseivirga sp. E12]
MNRLAQLASVVFLILLTFACSKPAQVEEDKEEIPEPVVEERVKKADFDTDIPSYKFEFSSLALNQKIEDLDDFVFKHYGEFYTEDFNIFRLDRIDYLAESHEIDDINLYYIDSLLVKIQVYLREDKTDEFLRRYGRAKIQINDYHNKKLLETEKVLVQKEGKYQVNDKLDAFSLKWDRKNLDIKYDVSRKPDSLYTQSSENFGGFDDKSKHFKITFQTKDFDNQLAWIKWESYKDSKGLKVEPASDR